MSEVVENDTALPGHIEMAALTGPQVNPKLEAARALAKQNPAAVANIVRGWVNGST